MKKAAGLFVAAVMVLTATRLWAGSEAQYTVLVWKQGLVFKSTREHPRYVLPLTIEDPAHVRALLFEFDWHWARFNSDLFHIVCGLHGRTPFYGVIIRADNRKTVLDVGQGDAAKTTGPWKEGETYHVWIEYDFADPRVALRVYQDGRMIHDLTAPINRKSIEDGEALNFSFSADRVYGKSYFPVWESTFSNLRISAR